MSQCLADNVMESLWFGDEDPNHTTLDASNSLAAQVAKLAGLKPFPVVAQRVMNMVSDPECSLGALGEVINSDPALAARTMRLANSAAFLIGAPVDTLDQALMRLGTNTVNQMVTAFSVMGMFESKDSHAIRIREHSVGVAAIVRVVTQHKGWRGNNQLFLCGLMHDLGKLLSLQTGEISYQELSDEDLAVDRVHLKERELLGYDHAVLGAHVLKEWKLPEVISNVVAWHHQPVRAYEEGGDLGLMVAFLRVADRLDHELHNEQEANESLFQNLAADAASCYVNVTANDFASLWPTLGDTRRDAISAFT